jgi:hypothetical protein
VLNGCIVEGVVFVVKPRRRFPFLCAALGFGVALVLTAFAYYVNSHGITYRLETVYLVLAPTSLILMATEHASPWAQAMVVLIFALSNSMLYAIVFFLIGLIWAAKKPN